MRQWALTGHLMQTRFNAEAINDYALDSRNIPTNGSVVTHDKTV